MPADELAAAAVDVFGADRVTVEPRLDDALETAVRLAEDTGDDVLSGAGVLVTGSVVTAGEARTAARRDDERAGASPTTASRRSPSALRRADRATRGALAAVLGLEAVVTLLVPRALAFTDGGLGRRPRPSLLVGARRADDRRGRAGASAVGDRPRLGAAGAVPAERACG